MKYPTVNPIEQKEEMVTVFSGYNHTLSCVEGFNYDQKNMTSDFYPVLSPRKKRGITLTTFTNFQGMIYADDLCWVDDGELYINGTKKTGFSLIKTGGIKTIVKMGAYLVFFPDKKWYNTKDNTYGTIEDKVECTGNYAWGYARADGSKIQIDVPTIPPFDGQYKMETVNGKPSIYQYSATTDTWNPITDVYTSITAPSGGTFANMKEGDGIKITIKESYLNTYAKDNVYINDEGLKGGDRYRSCVCPILKMGAQNESIVLATYDSMSGIKAFPVPTVVPPAEPIYHCTIERLCPDMSLVIECNNRLWGCSNDGHEIYASKLGDPTNWNTFQGISTDSWAATVGSSGKFTGAINYQSTPYFFKEESLIRIAVSSVGGHVIQETKCKGVTTSAKDSLAIVNNVLYYKSRYAVCAYDGSYPVEISERLGEDFKTYRVSAVAGTYKNKYYLCMGHGSSPYEYDLYVYDTANGLWSREDNTQIKQYCLTPAALYYVDGSDSHLRVAENSYNSFTDESPIDWIVESGNIGYLWTSKAHRTRINTKNYIHRLLIQAQVNVGSYMSVYINYDSSDEWEFLFDISGTTNYLINIPIRPHRCNHFRYKIVGHGDAKIYSITKQYTEGSAL